MRSPAAGQPAPRLPAPRLAARDAAAEAVAGIVQRPGRAVLTMLGTVLGVGAFVAVLGMTATGAGQISRQFTVLQDTTVTVEDNGPASNVAPPDTNPPIGFPADADAIAGRIDGVTAAGVWWPVQLPDGTSITGSLALSAPAAPTVSVLAASPGAVRAMGLDLTAGSPLTTYENDTGQHVAMIDTGTAAALGIAAARLASHPAVFIGGVAYTVVGIYGSAQRVVTNSSAMLIPARTALADFGNPQPGIGDQDEAQLVVATRIGAAREAARQLAAAELPSNPGRLVVTSPPAPQNLQSEVSGDLTGLFLILALVSLLIGAVGIANTTLVAVLERTGEIGLRRAVGARPRHIAVQFLAESAALGTLGGLVGTCVGVGTVVVFAAARDWTAVLNPAYTAVPHGIHPLRRARPVRQRRPGPRCLGFRPGFRVHDRCWLPGSGNIPVSISLSQAGLSFGQPWGAWGYLGDAVAQQYGFRMQPGSVAGQLGIDLGAAGGQDPGTLPQAEQDAIGKCSTITGDFDNAMGKGPLAGIAVLTNDVYNDVVKDQAVKSATQTWTACMARNGYHLGQPDTVFGQEIRLIYGGTHASPTATVSPEVNRAQIAAAVTDASCTDSSDLAGIYFAVQASYEQQIVNANQQALAAAVQQYRAAYAKELKKLPTLLETAKANPARA